MNSETFGKFWELWFERAHFCPCQFKDVAELYDAPLGVRYLNRGEVAEICDRVPDESWKPIPNGSGRRWHQEGDLIFVKTYGKIYGRPPEGADRYYGVSVCELPLDLVEKVAVLGRLPPFPEKP